MADPLLEPYRLKHLPLRNRIIVTAHEPAYAEDGMPKARYRAYHVERAKGGFAMTMTAGSATVSPDSPAVFNNLLVYKDEIVPWMRDLADAVHEHGAAVMIQLTHLGRRTRWDKANWLPVVSPSHNREAAHRAFPKQCESWDIDRIIQDYADAAERMQAANLDGIELEAYGHLIDQFWSPLTNELEHPYGGALDNRLCFTRELLQAIRNRVGPQFILGIRFTADEMLDGGLSRADGLQIARYLRDSGMVDFLNVIRGHIDTDAGLTEVIPIQGMPSAPHLEFAGEIRAAIGLPTLHAGRLQDVATARYAISSGKLDLVGLTRPSMADPHIVRKIMLGQEQEIRPCVGANYCLDRIYQGGSAYCIHNAATGRELSMPHVIAPAQTRRKVVVVGAGPAGLEAARVAAERDHAVVVLEAASQPGGQIRLAARSTRRREMMGIIDWRMTQCQARGVTFLFDSYAQEDEVLQQHADVVVIATGGAPHTEVLTGGNQWVVSAWDVLSGSIEPGSKVLLFDDAGDHTGLQAAEVVAATGATLEIVTPDRAFAPEVMGMNLVPYMRSLQRPSVTFTVTYRLQTVQADGSEYLATLGSDYGPVQLVRRVDQVIVNHGTRPLDELYFSLKAHSSNEGRVDYARLLAGQQQRTSSGASGKFELYRIGDAVSARNVHAAIYDALRLLKDV